MPIGHTVSAAYSLIQLKNSPAFPFVLQHETDDVMPYGCEFVPRQFLCGMYDDKTYLISLSYYVNVSCPHEWADESSFAGVQCTFIFCASFPFKYTCCIHWLIYQTEGNLAKWLKTYVIATTHVMPRIYRIDAFTLAPAGGPAVQARTKCSHMNEEGVFTLARTDARFRMRRKKRWLVSCSNFLHPKAFRWLAHDVFGVKM